MHSKSVFCASQRIIVIDASRQVAIISFGLYLLTHCSALAHVRVQSR